MTGVELAQLVVGVLASGIGAVLGLLICAALGWFG